ncbi:hypothetical protein D3P02_24310 [Escherichia coli]|nr:hypothetical protein [Salmonella enterica]KAB2549461.1 hypothetical protein D3P02_24310 [Escherichia coli]
MTSLKTSIKTITYLSDIGCLEIQGASLLILNIIVKRVTPDQPTTVITPECISLYIFCDEHKI